MHEAESFVFGLGVLGTGLFSQLIDRMPLSSDHFLVPKAVKDNIFVKKAGAPSY